jgi:hypothetical protein
VEKLIDEFKKNDATIKKFMTIIDEHLLIKFIYEQKQIIDIQVEIINKLEKQIVAMRYYYSGNEEKNIN